MKLTGTPNSVIAEIAKEYPINEVLAAANLIRKHSGQMQIYQAAALYALVSEYNQPGAHILEIGTALGYSALVIAEAAPLAKITTLNPLVHEVKLARKHLAACPNVEIVPVKSWDYLKSWGDELLDVVFVDGDHKHIESDLPWWEHLRPGGLFLFHDYSSSDAWSPCIPVYEALNRFRDKLGRDFDVLVMDDQGVGMAGWYK